MTEKITKEYLEFAILEELDRLDEAALNELLPGAGMLGGLKGMAKGAWQNFQAGRTPAVAQKVAKKYQAKFAPVLKQFNQIQNTMRAELLKYGKLPGFNEIIEGSGLFGNFQAFNTAQGQWIKGMQNLATGKVQAAAPAAAPAAAGGAPAAPAAAGGAPAAGAAAKKPAIGQGLAKMSGDQVAAQTRRNDALKARLKAKRGLEESLMKKIGTILTENKNKRIINNNGRKK